MSSEINDRNAILGAISWIKSKPAWPAAFLPSHPDMKADPPMSTAPDIFHPDSNSLAKQHLSRTLYNQLSTLKTSTGFTLEKAVASGIANIDSSIGIYVGDQETYTLFDAVFTPIIMAYHGLDTSPAISPAHKDGFQPVDLSLLDPDNQFIRSTRIRIVSDLHEGLNAVIQTERSL